LTVTGPADPGSPLTLWLSPHLLPPAGNTPNGQPAAAPPPRWLSTHLPVATLRVPIGWPADATADHLRGQVVDAVSTALRTLATTVPPPTTAT
jgi:hypothetical protein